MCVFNVGFFFSGFVVFVVVVVVFLSVDRVFKTKQSINSSSAFTPLFVFLFSLVIIFFFFFYPPYRKNSLSHPSPYDPSDISLQHIGTNFIGWYIRIFTVTAAETVRAGGREGGGDRTQRLMVIHRHSRRTII